MIGLSYRDHIERSNLQIYAWTLHLLFAIIKQRVTAADNALKPVSVAGERRTFHSFSSLFFQSPSVAMISKAKKLETKIKNWND